MRVVEVRVKTEKSNGSFPHALPSPPSVMEFREHGHVVKVEQVFSVKIMFVVLWYETRSESFKPGHLITLQCSSAVLGH